MSDSKFSIFSPYPFLDLNIYQYGYEKCESLHSFGPSIRNHYLFHYILSGKGRLISEGEDGKDRYYDLKEGEGFLIFPNQITTYEADKDEPWEYVWVEFDGLIVKKAMSGAGLNRDHPIFVPEDSLSATNIRNILFDITAYSDDTPYKQIGHLYFLLDGLSKPIPTKQSFATDKLSDYYINELIHYIERYYDKDITVEDMAKHLNLSRSHVGKIFKEHTGKTPKEFLTEIRMRKAVQLLVTTQIPIGQIGPLVGFSNPLNFSRTFKRFYGVSPKAWRQTNK